MLEDVLKNNNIPYLKQGVRGVVLTRLSKSDDYKFFVPFGAYKKAKELLEECFSEKNEIRNELDKKKL
jgi:predicted nucleotidyltransferase